MEYINEDCMPHASDLAYPIPCSPNEKIEEPFLQMTNSQIETEIYCLASSLRVANHVSQGKGTLAALCESCREPKKYHKRRISEYNSLDMVRTKVNIFFPFPSYITLFKVKDCRFSSVTLRRRTVLPICLAKRKA